MSKESQYLYLQIYKDLYTKIRKREIVPGQKLDSENILKEQYHVSRDTIRRALEKLENEGLISRSPSKGTIVTLNKMEYEPLNFHESFSERMKRWGYEPSSKLLSIELLDSCDPEVTVALRPKEGERVYCIKRIRYANASPMAYEIHYVHEKYVLDLHTRIKENTSVYDLYENVYDIHMGRIDLKLEADIADKKLIRMLDMRTNSAILKISSLMHLKSGEPFYYVISYHVGDKYTFSTSLPRKR